MSAPYPHAAPPAPEDNYEAMAAAVFDEALTMAGLSNKDVAFAFRCSESLVAKMRNRNHPGRVSLTQMLRLPPAFHVALARAMDKRYGFTRAAFLELVDAVGSLALLMDVGGTR